MLNSKFFIVVASLFTWSCTSDLCAFFFYEFCYVCTKATPSVSPPLPIALGICLVHVLKYCSYYISEHEAWADKIFKRFVNLRSFLLSSHVHDTHTQIQTQHFGSLTAVFYCTPLLHTSWLGAWQSGCVWKPLRLSS